MLGISGFFKNIQNSFTKEIVIRTKIKDTVKKYTGADIPIENIKLKDGTINLKKVSPTVLSVVYIKKLQILTELNNTQEIKALDIR